MPGRELNPAACWEGATPAAALLAMISERMSTKELVYSTFHTEMTARSRPAYATR